MTANHSSMFHRAVLTIGRFQLEMLCTGVTQCLDGLQALSFRDGTSSTLPAVLIDAESDIALARIHDHEMLRRACRTAGVVGTSLDMTIVPMPSLPHRSKGNHHAWLDRLSSCSPFGP